MTDQTKKTRSARLTPAEKLARLHARQHQIDAQIRRLKSLDAKRAAADRQAKRKALCDALEAAGALDLDVDVLLAAVRQAKAVA